MIRQHYQTLVDIAPDPIFVFDVETGSIQEVSDSTVDVVGYRKSVLRDKDMLELHPEEDWELYEQLYESVADQEMIRTDELPDGRQTCLRTRACEDVPIEIHARLVSFDDGDRIYSVARDVSKRVAYEEKLKQQRDLFEILNSIVRHDLRNDLQVVHSYSALLEDHISGDEANDHLDRVLSRTKSAIEFTSTANDVATLIREDDVTCVEMHLDDVIESQVKELQSSFSSAVIEVECSDSGLTVMADEMLGSVFRNLIQNAVVHNNKDIARVRVSVVEGDEFAVVKVVDNGPGISDGQKEKLFQKGVTGLESNGTGIGLYLVKTLVDGYGGSICVEDNEPEGTVFVVRLPLG